jgi:aspartyl-tRNA(Asn)/glutamyl-tRNA(Gln) amidotransferase subunit C
MEHLKKLARLVLDEAETQATKRELNTLLGYFAVLQGIDTTDLPEMPRPIALENILRSDETTPALPQATALAVGIDVEDGFFKVPRIVNQ